MNFSDLAAKRSVRLQQQQQRDKAVNVKVKSVNEKTSSNESREGETSAVIRILNEDAEVRQTQFKGRGVFARRHLKRGSTVLSTTPLMIALEDQYLDKYCSYTAKRGAKPNEESNQQALARCSLCKKVHYASKQAQISDWVVHKHECESLRTLKETPEDSIRVMARLMWMRDHQRSTGDNEWEKQLNDMHDTYALLKEEDKVGLGSKVMKFMEFFTKKDTSRVGNIDISIPYAMRFMSKIQTNAFALQGSDFETIGVAICPVVAYINHDHQPNCAAQFTHGDDRLSVTLLKDVNEGDEITNSYVDPTLPWSIQREALQKQYMFDIGDSPEKEIEADYTADLLKAVDIAEKTYLDHPLRAFQRLQPQYEKVDKLYPLHSKVRLRYMRVCFAIMISVSMLDDIPSWAPRLTVELGKNAFDSMKLNLPYGHPIRGLTLAELSKQMLANSGEESRMSEIEVVQKLEQCVAVILEALQEVKIGYGSDSVLERYLADEVASIQQEIQMRRIAAMAV